MGADHPRRPAVPGFHFGRASRRGLLCSLIAAAAKKEITMQALPMALARQFVVAHQKFHSSTTQDDERNALVTDLLSELRQHDPNASVWDLLHVFDRVSLS
jgi:hypothetical protein